MVNTAAKGTGVYCADPTDSDSNLVRKAVVTDSIKDASTLYVRIDFYRSSNIDSLPATYFGALSFNGYYDAGAMNSDLTATTAVTTTTTAATVSGTTATTKATNANTTTAKASATTDAAATSASSQTTKSAKGCGSSIAFGGLTIAAVTVTVFTGIRKKSKEE